MDKPIIIVTDDLDATAIYVNGVYYGKEDQVDPWELMMEFGLAERIVIPEENYEEFYDTLGGPLDGVRPLGN